MAIRDVISVERVRELLLYDADTGEFTSKQPRGRWGRFPAGSRVGTLGPNGRVKIWVDGYCVNAHLIAWALSYGEWPGKEIDHIDGDPANNRLTNLRLATRSQNELNKPRLRNNTSGFKGVRWNRQRCKWQAVLEVNGRRLHLGLHETPEAAGAAYAAKARELFGDYFRPD